MLLCAGAPPLTGTSGVPAPWFPVGGSGCTKPPLRVPGRPVTQVLLCTSITKKNNPIHPGCWYKENIIQAEFFIVFAVFFSFGHELIFISPELQCVQTRQVAPAYVSVSTVQGREWGLRAGHCAPLAHYPHCKMQLSGLACHRAWPNLSSAYKTCHHFCPRTQHSVCSPLTPAAVLWGHTLRAPQLIGTLHGPPN